MADINLYLRNFYKSGDKKWFEKIYHRFIDKLYRYFLFRVADKQAVEDLTSKVSIKIYKNLKSTNLNEKSFFIWMYKIAKNTLIDYYRKEGNRQEIDFPDIEKNASWEKSFFNFSPFLRKELSFRDENILESLSKLTVLQKEAVMLKFVEDLDYSTISRILGKKQATVRGIIFRGLSKLREELKNGQG
ncbi:MAG: sigma-70 family RNA polymerase sigma factor [Candidatus Humimicrobiaceae bacterium]